MLKQRTTTNLLQYAFSRPEFSLLKTSVMMTGEFDFDNVFYGMGSYDPSDSASDVHKKTVYYSAMSYALFVVFLVLMAILVTNLLVGLAVDDIKAVQEKASLQRLAMQVYLLYTYVRVYGRTCHYMPTCTHTQFAALSSIVRSSSALGLHPYKEKRAVFK